MNKSCDKTQTVEIDFNTIQRTIDSLVKLVDSIPMPYQYARGVRLFDSIYLEEHRTIKIRGPRQCGQSTGLINWLFENTNANNLGVVFTLTLGHRSHLQELLRKKHLPSTYIKLPTSTNDDKLRGLHNISYVAVDNASYFTSRQLKKVYEYASIIYASNPKIQIILVG